MKNKTQTIDIEKCVTLEDYLRECQRYNATPFPLPEKFSGREKEMQALTQLHNSKK